MFRFVFCCCKKKKKETNKKIKQSKQNQLGEKGSYLIYISEVTVYQGNPRQAFHACPHRQPRNTWPRMIPPSQPYPLSSTINQENALQTCIQVINLSHAKFPLPCLNPSLCLVAQKTNQDRVLTKESKEDFTAEDGSQTCSHMSINRS